MRLNDAEHVGQLEALRFGVVPRLLSFTPEILSMADDLQSRARWERDDIEEMMGEFTDEFGMCRS